MGAADGDSTFRMTQLTRLDRKGGDWEAKNTGIFTSLVYPLAKALRASHRRASTGTVRRPQTPERARPYPVACSTSALHRRVAG